MDRCPDLSRLAVDERMFRSRKRHQRINPPLSAADTPRPCAPQSTGN